MTPLTLNQVCIRINYDTMKTLDKGVLVSIRKRNLNVKDTYECKEGYGSFIKGNTYSIASLSSTDDKLVTLMDANRKLTYCDVDILKSKFKKV